MRTNSEGSDEHVELVAERNDAITTSGKIAPGNQKADEGPCSGIGDSITTQSIRLTDIRRDGGTQPRSKIDPKVVEDYKERMVDGDTFPPVDVFCDGTNYWLADGFHRYSASKAGNFTDIKCTVHKGTCREARWFSFAANKTNGLHRDRGDVKRAVEAILADEEWAKTPQMKIAEHVGCDRSYISRLQSDLVTSHKIPGRYTTNATRKGTTYPMQASKIGRKGKAKHEAEPAVVDRPTGKMLEDAEIVPPTTTTEAPSVSPPKRSKLEDYPALQAAIDNLRSVTNESTVELVVTIIRPAVEALVIEIVKALSGNSDV